MFWSLFGLPLLAKELAEQAARKRTYVIRTVYAALLSGLAVLFFWTTVYSNSTRSSYDSLGQGRDMLARLILLQSLGIALFVPAMTCGAITGEKETNTFGLLLLTRLSPSTILFEKYLGRVITMVTFLLLSFPLIGFCYALGGIQQRDILLSIFLLLTMVFQLTALSVFCSAFFRTTVAAFIGTYLIGAALFFGPLLLGALPYHTQQSLQDSCADTLNRAMGSCMGHATLALENVNTITSSTGIRLSTQSATQVEVIFTDLAFPLLPLISMMDAMFGNYSTPVTHIVIRAVPAWLSTVCFLILARWFLVRRAFATPQNYLLRFFRGIDRVFHALNDRFTRGVVLVHDSRSLPVHEPVAWREVSKKSLGTFRYLLRIFLLMEFPILVIGFLTIEMIFSARNPRQPIFIFLSGLSWTIGLLLIIVKSATVIAGERSSETLSVLLSTPLSSREIIQQKLAGVRRLILMVSVPILTVAVLQTWYIVLRGPAGVEVDVNSSPLVYLLVQVLNIVILLPLASTVALLVGLVMKTQTRAIFAALALVVVWIVLPVLASFLIQEVFFTGDSACLVLALLSPATLVSLNESAQIGNFSRAMLDGIEGPYVVILVTLAFYAALFFGLRAFTLAQAPYLLGRQETPALPKYREVRRTFRSLPGRHRAQHVSETPPQPEN